MKTIVIRAMLIALFVFALMAGPSGSYLVTTIWTTCCACTFALAFVRLTGSAPFILALSLFIITVLLPIAILGFVGEPVYGSWSRSVVHAARLIIALNWLHGGEMFIPLFMALALSTTLASRLGANQSSRRTREKPRAA